MNFQYPVKEELKEGEEKREERERHTINCMLLNVTLTTA
jgi:hypothetical protein